MISSTRNNYFKFYVKYTYNQNEQSQNVLDYRVIFHLFHNLQFIPADEQ